LIERRMRVPVSQANRGQRRKELGVRLCEVERAFDVRLSGARVSESIASHRVDEQSLDRRAGEARLGSKHARRGCG
jgi:hypothetical protein